MVVIRSDIASIISLHGREASGILRDYSRIIGYGIEELDAELKVELNPDRPDLFSFSTLLWSARLYFSGGMKNAERNGFKGRMIVRPGALKLRPFARSFIAEGRAIGAYMDELIDFQEKIHYSVGKDRKKSSIGLHDLEKIKLPVIYDSGDTERVSFETYDGSVRERASVILRRHPKGMAYGTLIGPGREAPFMFDSQGDVLSMPPVINGIKSVVDSTTRSFFVDITGTDRRATDDTMYLMKHFFDALGYRTYLTVMEGAITEEKFRGRNEKITLRENRVRKALGTNISAQEIQAYCERMGYHSILGKSSVDITIPEYRTDVMGEMDIIEDIAKAFGLNSIPEKGLRLRSSAERNIGREHEDTLRTLLTGAGLQEILSFVLVPARFYSKRQYTGKVSIVNPKSVDFSVVRDRLYLGILDFYSRNRNRSYPQNVFEIGEVLRNGSQQSHLCISIAQPDASFSMMKRYVEYIFRRTTGSIPIMDEMAFEDLIEGRSAMMTLSGMEVGVIGEVSPECLESFGIKVPVAVTEIDISTIFNG